MIWLIPTGRTFVFFFGVCLCQTRKKKQQNKTTTDFILQQKTIIVLYTFQARNISSHFYHYIPFIILCYTFVLSNFLWIATVFLLWRLYHNTILLHSWFLNGLFDPFKSDYPKYIFTRKSGCLGDGGSLWKASNIVIINWNSEILLSKTSGLWIEVTIESLMKSGHTGRLNCTLLTVWLFF